MSHPIMHAIGNVAVIALWVVGIPWSVSVPNSPQIVRLEKSVERLERAVERLESEHRPTMQQTNNITVPGSGATEAELQDQRVRDILAQWEQIDGLPSVARTASAKDSPVR